MKRLFIVILSIILVSLAIPVFATSTGGTSAQFLKIPIGPRPESMGGAFTGLADDGSALFWNPAGTGQFEKAQMIAGYIGYVAKIKYEYFAAGFPIGDYYRLGIGLGALNSPPMLVTTFESLLIENNVINNIYGGAGDEFNASSNLFILNLARKFRYGDRDLFYVGGNLKYVRESLADYKAFTLAYDLGILFKITESFRLGLSLQNLGGELKFISEKEQLPQAFRFGLSYFFVNNELNRLVAASDIVKYIDEDIKVGIGGEYTFRDLFVLRLGYNNADLGSMTAGLGVIIKFIKTRKVKGVVKRTEMVRIGINYAFVDYGDFGQTHRYSVGFRF